MKEIVIRTDDQLAFISFVNLAKSFGTTVTFITKRYDPCNWDSITPQTVANLLKCPVEKLSSDIQKAIKKKDLALLVHGIRIKTGLGLFEAKQLADLL